MTKVVGANTGLAPLARQVNGQGANLKALQNQQTTYVLDASGNCVFIIGDISHAPAGSYGPSPTMTPTLLSGFGAASKKTGTWVQL